MFNQIAENIFKKNTVFSLLNRVFHFIDKDTGVVSASNREWALLCNSVRVEKPPFGDSTTR